MLNVLSRTSRSSSNPTYPFQGQVFHGNIGVLQGDIPANSSAFQEQTFHGQIEHIEGQLQPSNIDLPNLPSSLSCDCPNQSNPGTWICVKDEEPQCTCQCKPFVVYEPKMTNLVRKERSFEKQQIMGTVGQLCIGTSENECNEPQNGSIPDQGVLPSSSTNTEPNPSSSTSADSNLSSNTNAGKNTSQMRPLEELVNDSGVEYNAHYFNLHMN